MASAQVPRSVVHKLLLLSAHAAAGGGGGCVPRVGKCRKSTGFWEASQKMMNKNKKKNYY